MGIGEHNRTLTREVWCDNCKNFTTHDLSKIVTNRESLTVKIWIKCHKCQNHWIKNVPRNEWWNCEGNLRTHYKFD